MHCEIVMGAWTGDKLLATDWPGWAWEFLRRKPAYRKVSATRLRKRQIARSAQGRGFPIAWRLQRLGLRLFVPPRTTDAYFLESVCLRVRMLSVSITAHAYWVPTILTSGNGTVRNSDLGARLNTLNVN